MKYVIGIIIYSKCILYMYKAFHFTAILTYQELVSRYMLNHF